MPTPSKSIQIVRSVELNQLKQHKVKIVRST